MAKTKKKNKSTGETVASGKTPVKAGNLAGPQRLNKVLAAAGLGSRRQVEELIVQGRVEIDREIVTDLARKVDPKEVTIKVDGQTLKRFRPVYFALNKPKGVLSTNRDPSGRMRVVDLVPNNERVFSVGRLDKSSEGLVLLTNDGELAQRLAHPKYRVQKTYFVVVSGTMSDEELRKLKKGVYLAEGFARIDGAKIKKHRKGCTEVEIILSEGKNREIRRILARAGHKVVVLKRTAIGPLRLGQLPAGASRELLPAEVKALYAVSGSTSGRKKTAGNRSNRKPRPRSDDSQPVVFDDQEQIHSVVEFSSGSDEPFGDQSLDNEALDDEAMGEFVDDDFNEFDDDFVGGFGDSSEGSVLAFDDDDSSKSSQRGNRSGKKTAHGKGNRPERKPSAARSKTRHGAAHKIGTGKAKRVRRPKPSHPKSAEQNSPPSATSRRRKQVGRSAKKVATTSRWAKKKGR